jgi:hypothetical protein
MAGVVWVVVATGLIVGLGSGALFPIAIGVAVSIAIFSESGGNCAPRFLRRRG